jgi:ribose/xylose/arabinose/galactoside ABC-type transport system permease subunit
MKPLSFLRRRPEAATITLVALISCLFVVLTRGQWLSVGNLQSLLRLAAVLAIMSFGEAIVIATGEIDISVGSTFGIGALTFLGLAPAVGSGLAIVAALVSGILIGSINGIFAALIGLPSLIVTLGTLFLFHGVAYAMTYGFSFAATDGRISLIGTLMGAFLLCGIQSFLIILGFQPQWYILALGVIVVLASLVDRSLSRLIMKKVG